VTESQVTAGDPWDDRAEHTPEEWAQRAAWWARYAHAEASQANHRAFAAANAATHGYHMMGRMMAELGKQAISLKALHVKVDALNDDHAKTKRETQESLHDIAEHLEENPQDNTGIRDLKAIVRAQRQKIAMAEKKRSFWIRNFTAAVITALGIVLAALITHWLNLDGSAHHAEPPHELISK